MNPTRRGFLKTLGLGAATAAVAPAAIAAIPQAAKAEEVATTRPVATTSPGVSGWNTNPMVFKYEAFVPMSAELLADGAFWRDVEADLIRKHQRLFDRSILEEDF